MNKTALPCFAFALLTACNPPAPRSDIQSESAPPPAAATVSATAPREPARPAITQTQADAALSLADKCFLDGSCDPAEAEKQYRIAADGGAKGLPCAYFYFGIRVAEDHARARACFERQFAGKTGCNDASTSLERALFATMLIDAQGGPADQPRMRALFQGCEGDLTAEGLDDAAKRRTMLDPKRKPLDFCEDIGGTTMTIGECHTMDREKNKAAHRRVEYLFSKMLDKDALALAKKAEAAFKVYSERQGEAASDQYRGGSIQSNAWARKQNMLTKTRLDALVHLSDYKPATPAADIAKLERELEKTFRDALDGDAHHKRVFADARKAWSVYRDAEIALYVKVFGDKFGKGEVERDIKAAMTATYKAEIEDAVKP